MTEKSQYSVALLPGNEVRFLSLSRTAKVKPEYRPIGAERYHSQAAAMFAVDHYRKTGKILLSNEVKAIVLKRKRACSKEREHEYSPHGACRSKKSFGCDVLAGKSNRWLTCNTLRFQAAQRQSGEESPLSIC
jgi:hypothetical protein